MAKDIFQKRYFLPILSLLVLGLLLFAAYDRYSHKDEVWSCSQLSCDKMMSPEEWVAANCFDAKTDAGQEKVCGVIMNNNKQLIPLRDINLSQVRQCSQFRCVQEIKTKKVNYIIQQ